MSEIALFFDTETSGLPLWKQGFDHPKQPDLVQLAAVLAEDGNIMEQYCTVIDPSDVNPKWVMEDGAAAAHGITFERIKAEGIPAKEALDNFCRMMQPSTRQVAHNSDFDTLLIRIAAHKAGYDAASLFPQGQMFCTMKTTTRICNIPGPYGPKWPKLIELHRFLFGEDFDGAHDALEDVRATMRCYYELRKRGLIK